MKTTTCGKIIKKKKDVGKTGGLIINNFCKNDFVVPCRKVRDGKKSVVRALIFVSAIFFASCTKKLSARNLSLTRADGSTVRVRAETARTDAERSRGFMKRRSIPDGTGMLFVFDKDERLSFWMKDTPHPLSIAYIDSSGRIRDIYDMTPFSLAPVKSSVSVRYALEVPQGWFDRVGVKIGDMLALDFDTHAQ